MSIRRCILIAAGCIGAGVACSRGESRPESRSVERHFKDGVLVSTCRPVLRLRPDTTFRYLGSHPFRIRELAAGERHVFADLDGRRVRRLLLLQFEGYLDGVDGAYHYRMTNPVTLGGEAYNQNVYLFRSKGDLAPEGIATRAFLERQGLDWPDEQMMSRFVRTVDAARRHELIVFYNENVADAGYHLSDIADDGAIRPEFQSVADALTARSLGAFTILPPTGLPSCDS